MNICQKRPLPYAVTIKLRIQNFHVFRLEVSIKFAVEYIAFLLRSTEALDSNLSPGTGYTDWIISLFSSVFPDIWQYITLNDAPIISTSFSVHRLQILFLLDAK
jgi:hypothetical protein